MIAPNTLKRRSRALAFIALTKPRIIELLLITTVPAMVLAWRFTEGLGAAEFGWLVVATLVGGSIAAGAANAMSVGEMRTELNPRLVPDFETAATAGDGVIDVLKSILRLVVRDLSADTPPGVRPGCSGGNR